MALVPVRSPSAASMPYLHRLRALPPSRYTSPDLPPTEQPRRGLTFACPPSAGLQHRLRLIAVVRVHRLPACSTDSGHRLRLHRHLLPVPAAREGKELRPGPGFRLLSRVESSPDLVRTAPRFRIIHTTPCSSILFSILITRPNSIHGLRFPTVCLYLWQPF